MSQLDELLDAVLDLRAALQAEQARGAWSIPRHVPEDGAEPLDLSDLPGCTRCARSAARTVVVGVDGPDTAPLVVVCDPPGPAEDAGGAPMVGPAAAMLDRMLTNVLGLARRQVLVTPAIKCLGPAGDVSDAASCLPWLDAQLDRCRPGAILVMGEAAAQAMFGTEVALRRHRGLWRDYRGIPAMPTHHPEALVQEPRLKRAVFEDLKAVKARLTATS